MEVCWGEGSLRLSMNKSMSEHWRECGGWDGSGQMGGRQCHRQVSMASTSSPTALACWHTPWVWRLDEAVKENQRQTKIRLRCNKLSKLSIRASEHYATILPYIKTPEYHFDTTWVRGNERCKTLHPQCQWNWSYLIEKLFCFFSSDVSGCWLNSVMYRVSS